MARGGLVSSSLKASPNICVYFALRHQVSSTTREIRSKFEALKKNSIFPSISEMASFKICHLQIFLHHGSLRGC